MSPLAHCELCPRRCGVNRLNGERGYCGAVGADVEVARAALHYGEEPCLGVAGAVFFAHCSLRCVFCQNYAISHKGYGKAVDVARLARIFLELQAQGADTLDLVTPTHYAPQVVAALRRARHDGLTVPAVWNSSGYETVEMVNAIADDIDVFLPDLKYYGREQSRQYSGAADYFDVASAAISEMVRRKGAPDVDVNSGKLRRGVLVRHLVLPGQRRDSLKLLDWLATTLGDDVMLSLMRQYTPLGRIDQFPELGRALTTFEYESVVDRARELGLTRCYVQERGAVGEGFVPDFDGSGV